MMLDGKVGEALRIFKDASGRSFPESHRALLSEFRLEHKLSKDMDIYTSLQKVESFEGLKNSPIDYDLKKLIEFVREQLYLGLNGTSILTDVDEHFL